MITPGRLDLVAQRWTPFLYVIDFPGLDFTGATFAMDWRIERDAATALLSLTNAAPSAQGISVSTSTADGVVTSHVQIRINETTLEGMLLGAAGPGKDVSGYQDLHITGGGFIKTRWTEGTFTIRAGATQ